MLCARVRASCHVAPPRPPRPATTAAPKAESIFRAGCRYSQHISALVAKAAVKHRESDELLTDFSAVARVPRRTYLMQTGYSKLNPGFGGCLDQKDEVSVIFQSVEHSGRSPMLRKLYLALHYYFTMHYSWHLACHKAFGRSITL